MGVVLVIGAPFVYIHLIQGTPPAKLELPAHVADSGSSSGGIDGVWNVGSGSIVGYRVQRTSARSAKHRWSEELLR